jgi:guanidinoacetate N-methyltransferase
VGAAANASLARETTRNGGDVLEVGFGMGISAGYIVEYGCASYTVIEPHPQVLQKARAWAVSQSVPVQIEEGFWQDVLGRLGQFDGILFDTFPLTKKEAGKNRIPFIPRASDHLRTGGVFTYYSDASETLGGDHLKAPAGAFLRGSDLQGLASGTIARESVLDLFDNVGAGLHQEGRAGRGPTRT